MQHGKNHDFQTTFPNFDPHIFLLWYFYLETDIITSKKQHLELHPLLKYLQSLKILNQIVEEREKIKQLFQNSLFLSPANF